MPQNPVVIAGSLSKEELEKSINEIVNTVDVGMSNVTKTLDTKLTEMQGRLRSFSTTLATNISTMTKSIGGSFDMLAASMDKISAAGAKNSRAAGATGATGKNDTFDEGTVGALKAQIKELNKKLDLEKLNTQELQKQVDLLQRAKSELKTQTTSRSFSSIWGMPENSATQIAEKMKALRNVQVQNADEAKKLQNEYLRLSQRQKDLLGRTNSLTSGNNALARSFNYIRNRLVYALTIGSVMSFVKQMYSVRAEYELLERSMGVLIDNFRRGSEIFNELNQMALKSPFTLVELGTAAKQLLAYNFAEDEVVDTTRRLADISAALGVPMERLVYNLGQIRAQTVLTARDARDFANAGLAIVPMLAKMYTEQKKFGDEIVTTAQVYDMMKKKLVTYEDVMKVINQVTDEGGKFFDFQAKQAETLKVQLANLTLAWNNMLNDIASSNQTSLNAPIRLVKQLFTNWREVAAAIKSVIAVLGVYKTMQFLQSDALIRGLRLARIGWYQYTKEIKLASGAMATFNAITKSNVLLALAGVLASVASYFIVFKDKVDDASGEIERFGESGAKTIRDVNNLYAMLKVANKDSSNYKKVMGELNQILEQYGLEQVKETDNLKELNRNREINIELLKQEALEREHLNRLSSTNERYQSGYDSEQKRIEEVLSKKPLLGQGQYSDNVRKYSLAISNIISSTVDENINDVLNKSGDEYFKGVQRILEKVKASLLASNDVLGLSETDINRLTSSAYGVTRESIVNLKELKEAQIGNTQVENDVYNKGKELIDQTATFNDKVKQTSRNLLSAANDTDKFYRKIDALVKQYQGKNIIEFLVDVKAQVPKWMMNMGVSDLSKFAANFTAIAEQATKQGLESRNVNGKQMSTVDIWKQGVLYTEALRQKQEQLNKEREKTANHAKKDPLGDALTKELQLITDIQKLYKEYTKAGIDSETAKNAAAKEYQKTLEKTNATLSKFGVQGLTGEKLATMDLRAMRDYYQSILDKVQSSPKAVEELEKAIKNLNVEITKEGQKTIIDSLNSELSKLKEEYELAIDLDANPELGGVFADMMGLSKEELEKLPRDFEGVVRKLQNVVDKELGMGAFDVRSNLNKDVFDEWVKSNKYAQDSDLVAKLKAITDYANKVRQDETKKQVDEWNKLLEKYAEYEYKRNQIMQDAEREREIARKKGAGSDVLNAIDIREQRELAKLEFEQFQQSPTWIAATGDLAGMTSSAIGMLINRLEQYKKSAKNLDPKQIKQINSALKKLYSEQRKGNPFASIANAIDEAKERFNDYQLQIEEAGERVDALNEKLQTEEGLTRAENLELANLIGKIKEWREEQEKVGKVSATSIVEGIQGMLQPINQVTGAISDMFSAFGNTEASETIQKVTQVLDKAGQFAAMGAQVGGGWGALVGGILGGLMGALTAWADEISGNAKITKAIKESEKTVKQLANAYEQLSWEAEKAYGVIVSGMQNATIENKKLQLAEAERQLQLEKSRSKKRYDEERVIELEGEVESLRREIKDATTEIVTELLGISSAGDEITSLVQVMIDAFRNGEDAMEAFGKEWDKMIDNMILKLIVTEYMKKAWDNVIKTIEDKEDEFLQVGNASKASAEKEIERLKSKNAYDLAKEYIQTERPDILARMNKAQQFNFFNDVYNRNQLAKLAGFNSAEELRQYLIARQEQKVLDAEKQIENASQAYTEWTLDFMMHEGKDMMMSAAEGLKEGLEDYYDFGELVEEQKLSNLQQGIQGITEDTASALEAYMNSVSQQVYLHSDLLTQIRDAVVGFDLDVQLGVQSQMLLQLQNNYIVIQSMQSLMENWTTPAGNGIRVEVL